MSMTILELVKPRPDWLGALQIALTRPPGVPERRSGEDPWKPADDGAPAPDLRRPRLVPRRHRRARPERAAAARRHRDRRGVGAGRPVARPAPRAARPARRPRRRRLPPARARRGRAGAVSRLGARGGRAPAPNRFDRADHEVPEARRRRGRARREAFGCWRGRSWRSTTVAPRVHRPSRLDGDERVDAADERRVDRQRDGAGVVDRRRVEAAEVAVGRAEEVDPAGDGARRRRARARASRSTPPASRAPGG